MGSNSQALNSWKQFQRPFSLATAIFFALLVPIQLFAGSVSIVPMRARCCIHHISVSSPTASRLRYENNSIIAFATVAFPPQIIMHPTQDAMIVNKSVQSLPRVDTCLGRSIPGLPDHLRGSACRRPARHSALSFCTCTKPSTIHFTVPVEACFFTPMGTSPISSAWSTQGRSFVAFT